MKTHALVVLFCLGAAANAAFAQQIPDLTVAGNDIQFHAFASQGFAYSNQNNWLTMNTSDGTPAMTEFGFNASTQITDQFRVGAQVYDRNIGRFGRWRPTLDWGYVDYRFADWFGVRAGKVKTVLGLFNDTQDVNFLHTFAILPQSVYPLDLRGSTIAHVGLDIYGHIPLKHRGDLAFTGYAGALPFDPYGGYVYGLEPIGIYLRNVSARQTGGDLRWNNPVNGLVLGASFLTQPSSATGTANLQLIAGYPISLIVPYSFKVASDHRLQLYTEYKLGKLSLDGEYMHEPVSGTDSAGISFSFDKKGWYGSAAYRFDKRFELGTYYARFYPDASQQFLSLPGNHIFDRVATANITLTQYWNLKIEGHFMNGYGSPASLQGFYPQDNPNGLKPRTNVFCIQTGWVF